MGNGVGREVDVGGLGDAFCELLGVEVFEVGANR
jgi:hypothetical protein